MKRVASRLRTPWRVGTLGLVLSVALAGCTTATAQPTVRGYPSSSISVPLHVVACTTTDTCVALGTSGADAAPSSVGEVRRANGTWTALYVPPALSSLLSSAACWSSGCLIGGTQPTGDLLWNFDGPHHSVVATSAPRGGLGISDLSCFAPFACAAVDASGGSAGARLSFTSDGGTTWSVARAMAWTSNDSPTALACSDALNCLASASTPDGNAVLDVTHDGGATWSPLASASSWRSLSGLSCLGLDCVGLASTPNGSALVRTKSFGQTWRVVPLAQITNALACTRRARCALVGQLSDHRAWLAVLHAHKLKSVATRYVPTPLTSVACGATVCAAINTSTVVSLRP